MQGRAVSREYPVKPPKSGVTAVGGENGLRGLRSISEPPISAMSLGMLFHPCGARTARRRAAVSQRTCVLNQYSRVRMARTVLAAGEAEASVRLSV